jgi:hypothetical protein
VLHIRDETNRMPGKELAWQHENQTPLTIVVNESQDA